MDLNEPAIFVDDQTRKHILDQPLTRLLSPYQRKTDQMTRAEAEADPDEDKDKERVNRTKNMLRLTKSFRIHPEQFYRSGQPVILNKNSVMEKSMSNTYSKVQGRLLTKY